MSDFKEIISEWTEEAFLMDMEGRAAKALRGVTFKDSTLRKLELRIEEMRTKVGNAEEDFKKKKVSEELKEILWNLEDYIAKNHKTDFLHNREELIYSIRLYLEFEKLDLILKEGERKVIKPFEEYFTLKLKDPEGLKKLMQNVKPKYIAGIIYYLQRDGLLPEELIKKHFYNSFTEKHIASGVNPFLQKDKFDLCRLDQEEEFIENIQNELKQYL